MKAKYILVFGCLLLLALGLSIAPVSAGVTRIEVEAIEIKCAYDPGEVWISDNIYHSQDGIQTGFRIALTPGDPVEQKAALANSVNTNLNLKTGKGNGWGTFYSENFVGTWNGKLTEWMPGIWLIKGTSIGHGISPEFDGWELRVEWESIDPADFPGECDGNDPVSATYAKATYLIPGG